MKSSTSTGRSSNRLPRNQTDDRKVEAPPPHQIDQRGGLALQHLLAPVDHHAADGRIGLHRDLRVLELAGPDDFETGALDFRDDLIETDPLEIVGIKNGRCEQEGEASEIVHACPQTAWAKTCRQV